MLRQTDHEHTQENADRVIGDRLILLSTQREHYTILFERLANEAETPCYRWVGAVEAGGEFGPIPTTAEEHIIQVLKGDEVLDQNTDVLQSGHAYWAYITGSVFRNMFLLKISEFSCRRRLT